MTVFALLGLAPAAVSAVPGALALTVPAIPGTPGLLQGLAAMASWLG